MSRESFSYMDLVIRNGRIFDGNGNPWFRGDVGVEGKRIVGVGDLHECNADRVIDANDLAVTPGFIDIHNHSDIPLMVSGRAESMVHQGVTTMITGNCGNSPFPLIGDARIEAVKSLGTLYGLDVDWSTMKEYGDRLIRQGISVNTGLYVGHGTTRNAVMGLEDRVSTPPEMEKMKTLVRQAMEEGCFGLSTGLGYSPGMYAETEEIIELCKVVAEYGGLYSTHGRPAHTFPLNIQEAMEIGERAEIPVQMAHIGSSTCQKQNWGKSRSVTLNLVDAARARGIDFTADIYPYTISGGGLTMYVPEWAQEGGKDTMLKRLADPDQRAKMRSEVDEMVRHRDWSQLLLYGLTSERYRKYIGKTVQEIADTLGVDPFDLVCDIIIREGGRAPFMGIFGLEQDIKTLLRHEAVMVGSDGTAMAPGSPLGGGVTHPRNYGTFARVIGKYVGEGVLSLTNAIHKMTGMPAWRLGLQARGVIKPGACADIVVFDPFHVKDSYTVTEPPSFPEGFHFVIVNGVITVEEGRHTGALAGEVLHK